MGEDVGAGNTDDPDEDDIGELEIEGGLVNICIDIALPSFSKAVALGPLGSVRRDCSMARSTPKENCSTPTAAVTSSWTLALRFMPVNLTTRRIP